MFIRIREDKDLFIGPQEFVVGDKLTVSNYNFSFTASVASNQYFQCIHDTWRSIHEQSSWRLDAHPEWKESGYFSGHSTACLQFVFQVILAANILPGHLEKKTTLRMEKLSTFFDFDIIIE